ncbi:MULTISPECIES: tetratricopeptide repeat protein [unclassified Modicisalibacter]|uniref:tetratricopeptide repeat protein n=1 Tax=unclassified Modicisalibacter TaxID=2679913 RepID=UPI001CCB54A1|nr:MULTISPECIES: tetratricopeptide repeat protein [unclassified Modicisalibacter]MBZ9556828.1 sel1 repeat family protein [Modicisalibacter sp. R2A 31.J]MBZ9574698.1 sel1 repeat family protein [Modicisalibacter sp. MOD 31.J]
MIKILIFVACLSFTYTPSFANSQSKESDTQALETSCKTHTVNENNTSSNPCIDYTMGLRYLNGDKESGITVDYKKAIYHLKKAWNKGVIDAGYSLSTMYYNGQLVEKDLDKVRELLLKSGKKGYVKSQRTLGQSYWGKTLNDVFEKDIESAIYWLKKAASQGDSQSAASLSAIYKNGDGVDQDESLSFKWRKQAALSEKAGYNPGQFYVLATYYEKGIGTEKNLVKAYKYYDLSGTAGVKGKQRIAKEMTQEQIDEALRESNAWQEENNIRIGGGLIRRVK